MKKTKQYFHFQPFSRKQRQVLNWWTEESPVKDCDGIIADGAIRSGKTVSMSLFVCPVGNEQLSGAELRHVR